jgi:hypothetical protein
MIREGDFPIDNVLTALNNARRRATYEAVGQVIGVTALNVSKFLGERRPEASWVVNKHSTLPTEYTVDQMHPDLTSEKEIIEDGETLRQLIREDILSRVGKPKVRHCPDCGNELEYLGQFETPPTSADGTTVTLPVASFSYRCQDHGGYRFFIDGNIHRVIA